jgi:hypothetical protein
MDIVANAFNVCSSPSLLPPRPPPPPSLSLYLLFSRLLPPRLFFFSPLLPLQGGIEVVRERSLPPDAVAQIKRDCDYIMAKLLELSPENEKPFYLQLWHVLKVASERGADEGAQLTRELVPTRPLCFIAIPLSLSPSFTLSLSFSLFFQLPDPNSAWPSSFEGQLNTISP